MKKVIVFSLMFLLVSSYSFAQSQWSFGPKIGLNFANLTDSEMDCKVGVNVGAFANYRMNDYFGIQPEILFSMQGAKADDTKLKLNYINIPVMAKAYLYKGLNVELGPQFGFNVGSKVKANGVSVDLDGYNTFDFAIGVGLAYEFEMGLTADFRYNISATKLYDDAKSKNSVIQLGIGWKF